MNDQEKALRERCDWLERMMLKYFVEINNANKGIRRLRRKLDKALEKNDGTTRED